MITHYLLAENRIKWVTKKESNRCIFCEIAKGNKKIPQKVLYKDRDVMVIMNIYPYNTGHLQVLPTRHVKTLEELSDEEYTKLFEFVKKSVIVLRKALKPVGFNIGINIGKNVAGASIEHLHVHIVPRYKRDFGFMEIISSTKVLPESIDNTYKRLLKYKKLFK